MATSIIPPSATPGTPDLRNDDDRLLQDDTPEGVVPDDADEEEDDSVDDSDNPDTDDLEDEDSDDEDQDEEDEQDEDVVIPNNRPTVKEIKAEFPEFFKKFPALKEAFFREIEFTKIFPTIDDAKEAIADNEAFSSLSDSALAGDPVPILESLEKTDKKAFTTFAASFLPALYKRDPEAYHTAITPVFESLVRQLYKSTDENIKNTAVNVAEFLFGTDAEDIVTGKKTRSKTTEIIEEQKKLIQERDSVISAKFRSSYSVVEAGINKGLLSMVLKDFDPEKVFPPLIRKQLAVEVSKRVMKQLESDASHLAVMGSRWKRAKANGYTKDDESKLVSTFLARAKSLVSSTREKVRTEATSREEKRGSKASRVAPARREVNGGRASGKQPAGRIDYRKMSDLDILNLD